jgi:hypothetical protein
MDLDCLYLDDKRTYLSDFNEFVRTVQLVLYMKSNSFIYSWFTKVKFSVIIVLKFILK